MNVNLKMAETLTKRKEKDLELLDQFCKRNNFDMKAIAQDYDARLREFEKEYR
ncbi:hypothetical protein [Ammoniphilus oxalaticus]|uniref:hypothetical protein n=1 Tax=Ammoniphilus oxalaticus TaxID=66863 RepID=UPI00147603BF|nr:hypothetical protein [Ammoniphilus oxalaticus]